MSKTLTNFQKVSQFNIAFGIDRYITPKQDVFDANPKLAKLRLDLIKEEYNELKEAIEQKDYPEIIDAISDILYVVHGASDSFGYDLDLRLNENDIKHLIHVVHFDADKTKVCGFSINSPFNQQRMEMVFADQYIKDKFDYFMDFCSRCVISLENSFESKNYKEFIDNLVVIHNCLFVLAYIFGFNLDETFDLVHQSNMSKICDTEEIAKKTVEHYKEHESRYDSPSYKKSNLNDGKWIVYNHSTGKALKSINYKPVDLKGYIQQFT